MNALWGFQKVHPLPQPSALVSTHLSRKGIVWYVLSSRLCLPIYFPEQITLLISQAHTFHRVTGKKSLRNLEGLLSAL